MIVDIHCHYTFSRLRATVTDRFSFEPTPDSRPEPDRPTDYDSCVSDRALGRPAWRTARWLAGLPRAGNDLDRRLASEYESHFSLSGPVERYVLLAFDAVHDDQGDRPSLPGPGDKFGSDIYTSNSLVRDICRRHPERFLFGASIHPYRPNAVACVEEAFAAGACLLKWIPLHHNIDVADKRTVAVLRKCAQLGLPLLVHCGEEYTLTTHRPDQRSVEPLLATLRMLHREGSMPPTIIAHVATPVTPLGSRASYRALVDALTGDMADAPLYADISALATWGKAGFLRQLLRRPELHAKLLFGSDFPVPPGLFRLRRHLASDYRAVSEIESWPQRIATACRVLGFNDIVMHRAAELLPNVDFFPRWAAGKRGLALPVVS